MSRKTQKKDIPALSLPGLEPAARPDENSTEPSAERRLFYVTNGSNLRSILASGLIRLRDGWPKYAPDFQELTPGYIPLFCGGVPHSQVLSQVTKHDRHDLPVIIEFDAKAWSVPDALCVLPDGKLENLNLAKAPQHSPMVLLRGVVPLVDVRRVHFASAAAAKRFSSDCQALANTRAALLSGNDDFEAVPDIPPVSSEPLAVPTTMPDAITAGQVRRIDAVGGVLAALTRMPQAGGEPVVQAVFPEWPRGQQPNSGSTTFLSENLILSLTRWIQAEKCKLDDTMSAVLCCTLDFLSAPSASTGYAAEALLEAITQQAQHVPEKDQKPLLERLQSVRGSVLNDDSPAPFFQRKGSPVLRGLLLFLLDSEYREARTPPRGCIVDPQDLLIAEIMRGVLKGWSRLPVAMRGDPQAELAVGYAMARLANNTPGAVRFEARSFAWTDEGAALAAILREIAAILSDKVSPKALQQLVRGERAEELDVRVKAKRIKGVSVPVVERDLKKGKKATLTFTLSLPWN